MGNFFYNKIMNKKGNGIMNGFLIVLLAMGIGTICITYFDYKAQSINNVNQEFNTIITVEDSINSISNSNGYKYKTNISLGEIGNAYLAEETISKELSIYSGLLTYTNGDSYGIRITIIDGEDITFGFSGEIEVPIVFTDYLKNAALKMYHYRY